MLIGNHYKVFDVIRILSLGFHKEQEFYNKIQKSCLTSSKFSKSQMLIYIYITNHWSFMKLITTKIMQNHWSTEKLITHIKSNVIQAIAFHLNRASSDARQAAWQARARKPSVMKEFTVPSRILKFYYRNFIACEIQNNFIDPTAEAFRRFYSCCLEFEKS